LRQLGDRRPALARANHSTSRVVDDAKHDGDDTGHADHAAIDNDVTKLDKHDAAAGRWLSNDHYVVQHHNDAGQLPHPSREWRSVLVSQSSDHDGHGAEPSLRCWRPISAFFRRAHAVALVRDGCGAAEDCANGEV
jgi:hypothetical protein